MDRVTQQGRGRPPGTSTVGDGEPEEGLPGQPRFGREGCCCILPELQPKSGRKWGKNTLPLALCLDILQGSLGVEVHIHQIPAHRAAQRKAKEQMIFIWHIEINR